MASLPPEIDQRTYKEIVRQIEYFAEQFTGKDEIETKSEDLIGRTLTQDIRNLAKVSWTIWWIYASVRAEFKFKAVQFISFSRLLKNEHENIIVKQNTVISQDLANRLQELAEKVFVKKEVIAEKTSLTGNILGEEIQDDALKIDAQEGTFIDENLAEKLVEYAKKHNLERFKVLGWKPKEQKTDAGGALIRIFAGMVKTVSDRLNQVPEKNFLAFLDLIGGQLKPPQPAKVPLTFHLAEGSPVDGLVPAHTQVSAPPAEGSDEEIVFETDRELVVTTAQLKAVFVREPSRDMYRDCTLEATGQKDAAFLAFAGDREAADHRSDRDIPHFLYITCPEIFALPEIKNLDLIITGDTERIESLQEKLDWSYWDGSQWIQLTNRPTYNNDKFIFSELPILNASEIDGKTGKWLQAKLTDISAISENSPQISEIQSSIEITKSSLIPEVCLFNNAPLDLSKDFYPFGEQPQLNDTFYIALHDTYIKPNASITIGINLTNKPKDIDNLEIAWEIGNGQVWQKIEIAVNEDEKLSWTDEYELNLISLGTVENLPNEEKSLVILAKIGTGNDISYHIRIFNKDGKKVVDKGKDEFAPDQMLKKELNEAFESQPIDRSTKSKLIQKITSSLGYSPLDFTEAEQEATLKFPNNENMPSPSTVNGETLYWIRARITQGHYGKLSKERKYAIYNEVATIDAINTNDRKIIDIVGNAADFFSEDNVIRLVWINNSKEERAEYEIESINTNKLTLKKAVNENVKANETKIFLRDTISETIPPTYDPPLVKSLKLAYNFTLEENPIYFANNDLIYSHPDGDFRPFTPTIDKDPTLYLGFDKSFDNKTVNLYVQVEPPLPDELSTDITTETFLTEAANVEQTTGQTTLKLADVTGWKKGDAIEIQNLSNSKQYDSYKISEIGDNQITIYQPLQQNNSQGSPVIYLKGNRVIYPPQPRLVWEYSSSSGWQTLGVQDETQAFSQRGLIQFIAPVDFSQRETFGKQLYWLRVRWQSGNFWVKPRLRRILTNTMWAVQAASLHNEILGSSNDEPNQIFWANHTPILLGQQLEIQEGQIPLELASDRVKVIKDELGEIESVWVLWQEVADFYGSGKSDPAGIRYAVRHYTLDRQTGEIRFGDGQTGMIPPRGRNNIRLSFYRTGGGKQGNVGSQTVSQLKTTIPYIDKVINLVAAAGGGEQETLDRLKERVPKQLRHRDRAVTHDDIADLAYEASTDVARVKVVTPDSLTTQFSPFNEDFWLDPNQPNISLKDIPKNKQWETMNESEKAHDLEILEDIKLRAGQVKLIILPNSRDRQPVPSLGLLEQVETYIRDRCQPTMDLVVTAPKWQEVAIETTIVPRSLENADLLKNQVRNALATFLHPLTGGRNQKGWQFGRHPHGSDFYAIIQSISGVNSVDSLKVLVDSQEFFSSDKSDSEEIKIANLSFLADTLIYSGNHIVKLKQ